MAIKNEIQEGTFSWHSPNCGAISIGYKDDKGNIKVKCKRCNAIVVRRIMSRRHDRLDIYRPQ